MATERPSPTGKDARTEVLDEPTGSIEFGPRRAAVPNPMPDDTGEDAKPPSSSNLGGREDAAIRKAEARHRNARSKVEGPWRQFWRKLRGLNA